MPTVSSSAALGIGISIRGAQIVVSLVILILGALNLSKVAPYASIIDITVYTALGLVCGILGLIFYIPLITPAAYVLPPVVVLVFDIVMFIFWITAVALAGYFYGPDNCSAGYTYTDEDGDTYSGYNPDLQIACETGKGIIGIGVVGFLLSIVLIVLVSIYSVAPAAKSNVVGSRNWFAMGGIYPKYSNAMTDSKDAEAGYVAYNPHEYGTLDGTNRVPQAQKVQNYQLQQDVPSMYRQQTEPQTYNQPQDENTHNFQSPHSTGVSMGQMNNINPSSPNNAHHTG